MIRSFRLVACVAVALAAVPLPIRAATEPQLTGPICEPQVQQPEPDVKEPWRERFGEWIRKHALRDDSEGGSYYLRSPLLTAFGLRMPPDCGEDEEDETALARSLERCAAIVVDTRADARMSMELPLPQLGARDRQALVHAVEESLARGEPVRIYDHEGNPLILDPAITKAVQSQSCG